MGASDTVSAVATAVEMVEVIAPANMAAGYSFQAIYKGVIFPVVVPDGGVREGQKMVVPFGPDVSELTPLTSGPDNAPRGRWKDGLCDCLKFGICHPTFLNACCFPQILIAQVLTRLKMNLLGEPAPANEWKATFSRMLIIVITYWLLSGIFAPPGPDFEVNDEGQLVASRGHYPLWKRVIYNVLTTSFGLYTLIILAKLRAAVRKRYDIPQQRCAGLEDLCCAFWCSCCTVSQIARQTADYEQKRAICCSDTGLPATSSAIIV